VQFECGRRLRDRVADSRPEEAKVRAWPAKIIVTELVEER